MKSVISAALMLIFIIVTISVSYVHTDKVTSELLAKMNANEKNVAKNDWKTAKDEIYEIKRIWNKERNFFFLISDHALSEAVDESVEKLIYSVEFHKTDAFFDEAGTAKLRVKTIAEQQKFSFPNLF